MFKYISIIIIVLLLLINVFCLNRINKVQNTLNDIVKNYEHLVETNTDLIAITSESFVYEGQTLSDSISVCTETNDSILLCDIFNDRTKLVMRYTTGSCEACVNESIEMLKKIFKTKTDNVIILTGHEQPREMTVFKRKYLLKSSVYSIRDLGVNPNNNICFFVMDSSLLIKSFFIPTPLCPDLTEHYLNIIANKYFNI